MNTSLKALYNRLRNSARDLRAANSGNITVIFALSIVPMVGLVGAAVDYSNANSVKAAMQAASDATALMLAKYAPTTDAATLQTKANDYFKAIFNRPEANGVTITAAFNPNANSGSQVVVTDNRRHFLSALRYEMRVETPGEFLAGLKGRRSP